MTGGQRLNMMDFYHAIRNFGDFLKTDVKVSSVAIECVLGEGDTKTSSVPGYTIDVEISNSAPVEPNNPLIVFMGVGLRVKFPETIHGTTTNVNNEANFKVDLTNAPQTNPVPGSQTKKTGGPEFPGITPDEKKLGYVLFPGQSIKYKFSLMDTECPDVKEIKLWAEGTISRRHLLHHRKEIIITDENIVYQL